MLTTQDIAKLQYVFMTKKDLAQLEQRLEQKFVTKEEFFEQMTLIVQEFTRIHARLDRMEIRQKKMEWRLMKMEKFVEVCTMKLLNHDGRLTTPESKAILN